MASIDESRQDYPKRYQYQHPTDDRYVTHQRKSTVCSQAVAVAAVLPLGAILLLLAGLTLTGTVMGLAVISPLFVIFSPVLVPTAIVIGLAVARFLTSGAFGITGISSFAWIANYLRRSQVPEYLEYARRQVERTVDHVAKRAREAGQNVRNRAQEKAENVQNKAQESGQRAKNTDKGKERESGQRVKNKAQEEGS